MFQPHHFKLPTHNILKITHNAGFFSCATIRLIEIMKYFNTNHFLPDEVDSAEQFAFYKKELSENIVHLFYKNRLVFLPYYGHPYFVTKEPGEVTFSDYSKLRFEELRPFVQAYFSPSDLILKTVDNYKEGYNIDYDNTCAVFYRGNDKKRECELTPYSEFIDKAREVLAINPNMRFLVQPDETEFLEAFTQVFGDRCFFFTETPSMRKKDSAIFYELPPDQKTAHGVFFMAAVVTMSKCKHLITHSGNGGMWAVLYRDNFNNVYQFRNEHIY